MPTPVPAARQCLAPAAVTALDAAVASARRRGHAQTTSLHLIASLLAPTAAPLLRDALARARSNAYSPRIQLKALDLCFAVSLDRLPSTPTSASAGSSSSSNDQHEPPVANSFMAAIKRSQANQGPNPDTFHFYHQQQQQAVSTSSPSAVKVDLSHLVLVILDDPLVSRVFADAGFRSNEIKLAILRPAPPVPLLGRGLPTHARPPPLFLCSFAATDDADVPSPAPALAGAAPWEDNCRRITDILARGRNPMLVGVGAASAAADFAETSPYRILPVCPASVNQNQTDLLTVTVAPTTPSSGLIFSIGDLKDLVPEEADLQDAARRVVAEVTRLLETHRAAGRQTVWVMGWSATYETYLAFLSKFPLVDKDWELQLLPITATAAGLVPPSAPATTVAALSMPGTTSFMESFIPFGGFMCDTYEANSLRANSCPQALRCQQCNDGYEQEVATIIRGSGITAEAHQEGLPSLLQDGSIMGPNNGFDALKARDDQMVLSTKIQNLNKKWNEYCLRVHQGCNRINRDPCQLFPHHIDVGVDRERCANPNQSSQSVALQREVIRPSAVSSPHTNTTAKSVSAPSISTQMNADLVLNFQVRQSKSDEPLQDRAVPSQHSNPEDHASPSSAAPVATDLVLATPRGSSSKDSSIALCKHVENAKGSIQQMPKKVDDLNLKPPHYSVQPYTCFRSSSNWDQTSPSALHSVASGGASAFGQLQRPSPLAAQSFDLSNYKLLMERLFKAVGRQEEALSAICASIVRCRSTERRRGKNKKNDIWFSFYGPDSIAKRRVGVALAELMHGSSENLIYLDLSLHDYGNPNFREKNFTDCISEELRRKRRSVIFLDNIDKADCLIQESLIHAMQTGRYKDLHGGRVADLNDSIVVLSTKMIQGCQDASLGLEEGNAFSEEKAVAACRASRVPFDLNLPGDEAEAHDGDEDNSSSHENSSSDSEGSVGNLLRSVDESINFKPFDCGILCEDILQEFSNTRSYIPEDHASPSSAAHVATDLVLATPGGSSSKDSSIALCKHVEDVEGSIKQMPKKVDNLNLKPPHFSVQPYTCFRSSSNWDQTSPSALHSVASGGASAFGQWQRPSPLAAQSYDFSNYRLLMERLFKAVGRQEEALSAICASIVRCRSTERHRGENKKNDIWFSFYGPDSIAKRRVGVVLAELMHGSSENLIYLDLSLHDCGNPNFRGKHATDCISEELRRKRRSVIFLDNIDKADCLVQESLIHAMETGRYKDLHGGLVADLNDSIVVLSTKMIQGCQDASLGLEEGNAFSEEKVVAARRTSRVPFDMNLPDDEAEAHDDDEDNSSSHENSSGDSEGSVGNLLRSVDESINFKPFDCGILCEDILLEFSNTRASDVGLSSASRLTFLPRKGMEAAISSSLGAMGPVLRKLDLLLAPEFRLRKRVKDGIGLLKEDLEEVSSALVDLSMVETPRPRAKCWMEEARELSYHVEDFVDELMRTDAGAKIRSASSHSHRVGRVKIALLPAPPRRSTRVTKIAQLRDLLWQASERLERYQLDACYSSPKHMNMITQHRRAPALYGGAANLVGIEDSRTNLIEMLTGEEEQKLKVVSIVGPAGVGKTTLAKEIFREVRGQFELRAFVHAPRKIDMRMFLGSILSQVQPHHQLPSVAGSVQSLIDIIQEQLQDKRYFIVIDDLWEETAWDIIRDVFPEGNNCSRIVATTENMNLALKCCSYIADNILKMKPLGIRDSGYLFFNRVFGSEQQCPVELKEVSYGIIRKCCGLPLSLIHVAGLLASIDFSEAELWYHVHDCLYSVLNRSHTAEEIQKKILNLSYNSLPHHLRTCLLYFSMYPEGYIMWKGHLVKQWIAEGFINAAGGKDREETAEGYFEELVNRGMVQPMKIDCNDEVLSCTVHHIIFDLINHNSKEEEFIYAIDYSQPITGLSIKAHRLSFRFSSAKYAKQPARITMSQLRSLGFFGFIKCMPPIVEFKHLRVIVLDFWGSHDGHMSLNLSRICILFQLRYLKISGDIMVELPAQMQGLHYLETLEIDARLSAVPLDIVRLPSLLHLGLRAATKLPDGIGHIKSLSTLLYFDLRCNSEDNIWSLSKLTNLQHLHLTCSAALSSDHLKRKLIPLYFCLGKFVNLKSLTLTPDALKTAVLFDMSGGISSPMFLRKLELLPPICFFSRLPAWFGELHKLSILKIVVKELQGNDINNIAGLPSLVVLSLYVQTALTGTIVFSTMAFPALKYFKFTCSVISLAFQAGTMPSLRRLKLCFNAHKGMDHSRMLDGIEHLLNLQDVAGRIGVFPGADESDWSVAKLLFEDTIRKHPRCPRFNSQLVDFIEAEYPPLPKFRLTRHEGLSSEHENIEKACAEDMDKHIDSRLSREFNLPPASGTSYHLKSDEYSKHHMLVSILRDESAEPTTLDLSLLEDITNNFSTEQEIDQGGFGMVYKGILGDGVVAVKRLCGQHETVHRELTHVVDCLMTVKHINIVRFLGYWAQMHPNLIEKKGESLRIEQQDMLLCFEYLHNGSLRRHITDESCGFEWDTRYQIMKGICQGLDYLHENHIIHLHLKPENILLDANMVPKIADYAYARFLGEDRRTATFTSLDYMAPEYYEDGAISVKSDIYSLGFIIMQMVTGDKDPPDIKSVLEGWRSRLESDTSQRHTELETAYRQVVLCIELGKCCMHRDPTKRPCIRDIIDRLAEMEASEESSVTRRTSSVPKFRWSGEEPEASLITPLPTSANDSLHHHQEIKISTDEGYW